MVCFVSALFGWTKLGQICWNNNNNHLPNAGLFICLHCLHITAAECTLTTSATRLGDGEKTVSFIRYVFFFLCWFLQVILRAVRINTWAENTATWDKATQTFACKTNHALAFIVAVFMDWCWLNKYLCVKHQLFFSHVPESTKTNHQTVEPSSDQ